MHAPSATVAASNAHRVLRFGRARGFEPRALEQAQVDESARIPADQMYELWASMVRALARPTLPIELARESRLEDLGLLGLCVATAPTFLHALQTFARFDALLNQSRRFCVVVEGARLEVRLESASARSLGVRLSHETALAQLLSATRELCGTDIEPAQVGFRHAGPGALSAHRGHFGEGLRFDQPHDRVVLRRELCEAVPPSGNAALWARLCARAEVRRRQLAPASMRERVGLQLDAQLPEHSVAALSIRQAARSLGTSERSLRRALHEEGTTYRALCDALRRQRAEHALARGVSLSEAAFHAGFADASAFTHACRRWFGKPPSALSKSSRS